MFRGISKYDIRTLHLFRVPVSLGCLVGRMLVRGAELEVSYEKPLVDNLLFKV
jgi:hypothetical protein